MDKVTSPFRWDGFGKLSGKPALNLLDLLSGFEAGLGLVFETEALREIGRTMREMEAVCDMWMSLWLDQ